MRPPQGAETASIPHGRARGGAEDGGRRPVQGDCRRGKRLNFTPCGGRAGKGFKQENLQCDFSLTKTILPCSGMDRLEEDRVAAGGPG